MLIKHAEALVLILRTTAAGMAAHTCQPSTGREREEEQKFKVLLGYTTSVMPVVATLDPVPAWTCRPETLPSQSSKARDCKVGA